MISIMKAHEETALLRLKREAKWIQERGEYEWIDGTLHAYWKGYDDATKHILIADENGLITHRHDDGKETTTYRERITTEAGFKAYQRILKKYFPEK